MEHQNLYCPDPFYANILGLYRKGGPKISQSSGRIKSWRDEGMCLNIVLQYQLLICQSVESIYMCPFSNEISNYCLASVIH